MRRLLFPASLSIALLMVACDDATGPQFGTIALSITAADAPDAAVSAQRTASAAMTRPSAAVAYTGVRVVATPSDGGTPRTLNLTLDGDNWTGSLTNVPVGTYSVLVEALEGSDVAETGQTTVNVAANQTATASVTLTDLRPALGAISAPGNVLSFSVSWSAVTGAESYRVEYAPNQNFSGTRSQTETGTSAAITVDDVGDWFVRVRSVSDGRASAPGTVQQVTIAGDDTGTGVSDDPDTAPSLGSSNVSQTLTGLNIAPSGDQDWFALDACEADTLFVAVDAEVLGSPLNARLTVRDSTTKTVLATADDVNGLDPELEVVFAADDRYEVLVEGVDGSTGHYELVVEQFDGPINTGSGCQPQPDLVTVSPGTDTLAALTETVQLTAVARDPDGDVLPGATFQWSSDNEAAVTVDANGVVTAVANGTATITATADSITAAADGAALVRPPEGSATITVSQVVTAVAVAPNVDTIAPGATLQLSATATDSLGFSVPGINWFWISSNINVALVDTTGLATGVAGGDAIISAVAQGEPGNAVVNVTGPPLGTPTALAFSVEPVTTTAGEALAVTVEVQDQNGNMVPGARDQITLAISTNPGGATLSGSHIVNANMGTAQFPGVFMDKAATGYALSATASGLTGATSASFDIMPGAPRKLGFGTLPTSSEGNVPFSPDLSVNVLDAFDNLVTIATDNVTIELGNDPWDNPFGPGGALTGGTTVAAVNGVSTLPGLSINKPATGYTLLATAPGLAPDTSDAFDIGLTVQSVSASEVFGSHTCALTTGGTYCWGNNGNGQLGGETGSGEDDSVAVLVGTTETFVAVDAGRRHSCGLTAAGAAWCWGDNSQGQLGDGSSGSFNQPPVAVAGGLTFSQVSAGQFHTCGIAGTSAYCWGDDGNGQLGDDAALVDQSNPVLVAGGLAWASVETGYHHTCAVTTGGDAYCWGNDGEGQLGDDASLTQIATPVLVAGGLTWQAISAGYFTTCAVTVTDIPYCWGWDGQGKLGNDSALTRQPTPVQVAGGLTLDRIDTGYQNTCGVTAAGDAWCWGDNAFGQLGDDNAPDDAYVPVMVSGGLSFDTITVGREYACGLVGTEVYCWGRNFAGQLGDGSRADKSIPTRIVQ